VPPSGGGIAAVRRLPQTFSIAMATITLPPEPNVHPLAGGNTTLKLTDVNRRSSSLRLAGADENS
jgi:hypothetical protein